AIEREDETARLQGLTQHFQALEDQLPVAAEFRKSNIEGLSPLRIVDLIFGAGMARGARPALAFNLANNPKVTDVHGTANILFRNVHQAKFHAVVELIARRVLPAQALEHVTFDAFLLFVLLHERAHALGPRSLVRGPERVPIPHLLQET